MYEKVNDGRSTEVQGRSTERFTLDADQYENALEERFNQEAFMKNKIIKSLKDQIAAKDKSIARMREQLQAEADAEIDGESQAVRSTVLGLASEDVGMSDYGTGRLGAVPPRPGTNRGAGNIIEDI